jgi:predicted secreted Zn-dependent protease
MFRRLLEVITMFWRRLRIRSAVLFVAVFLVVLSAAISASSLRIADMYQGQTAAADTLHSIPSVNKSKPAPTPAHTATVASGKTVAVNVPACTPQAALPLSPLSLANAGAGLSVAVDSPRLYAINGYTVSDLHSQIQACAPRGSGSSSAEFTAETNYQLNWQYDYSISGDTCTITTVKVGLHVNQDMPSWQILAGTNARLQSEWSTFIANLQTHENGHVALDKQYAQTLLDDLRNFPPTACTDFSASIKHLTDTDVAVLNQANDNYDTATNHGTTQGAILP